MAGKRALHSTEIGKVRDWYCFGSKVLEISIVVERDLRVWQLELAEKR